MTKTTLVFAALLIVLGVGFYIGTGMASVTALIPAILGVLLGLCGVVALAKPSLNMHLMHAAMVIALLGVIGAAMRLPKATELNPAIIEQILMLLLCLAFIGLGVKSFIDARRQRSGTPSD